MTQLSNSTNVRRSSKACNEWITLRCFATAKDVFWHWFSLYQHAHRSSNEHSRTSQETTLAPVWGTEPWTVVKQLHEECVWYTSAGITVELDLLGRSWGSTREPRSWTQLIDQKDRKVNILPEQHLQIAAEPRDPARQSAGSHRREHRHDCTARQLGGGALIRGSSKCIQANKKQQSKCFSRVRLIIILLIAACMAILLVKLTWTDSLLVSTLFFICLFSLWRMPPFIYLHYCI